MTETSCTSCGRTEPGGVHLFTCVCCGKPHCNKCGVEASSSDGKLMYPMCNECSEWIDAMEKDPRIAGIAWNRIMLVHAMAAQDQETKSYTNHSLCPGGDYGYQITVAPKEVLQGAREAAELLSRELHEDLQSSSSQPIQ